MKGKFMHNERMKELGRAAIPRKGTLEWELFQKYMEKNKNNPEVMEYTKQTFNEAVASCQVQELSGAGLPADTILREYNTEYNNRVFNHSLHQLPGSFNVVEAFNSFIPRTAIFKINKEIDSIFSFDDFLDFVTSDACPNGIEGLGEHMEDGTIYSFNSVDDPESSLFSTNTEDEFGVLSISLIKHKTEVSVVMLAGQKCDLQSKSQSLNSTMATRGGVGANGIAPDKNLTIEAVPLQPNSNLWRTVVLTRFDLNSLTTDSRYIYQDAGRFFVGCSDDIDCFLNNDGEFPSQDIEDSFKTQNEKIEEYSPLFELCKTALFLPMFRTEYEDTISIERHPTEFGQKRNKASFRKTNKLANSEFKVSFRNVESIQPINRIPPSRREFNAPDLKVETSGYWKKLDFQSRGEDKNNQPIQGRTWVSKTLEWKESLSRPTSVKVVSKTANIENEGYIYVMRSAAHEKNVFKVGLTRRTPEERSNELSRSTSAPDHFHVMEEWDVVDCVQAEKLIHERLNEFRVNPKREYFKAPYKVIFRVIDSVIDELEGNK
ncbi:GIY-YIG nuclease family protein [Vibrio fluvialis]|nr:GIY-YIG nuclease family protein [Vibrio fluvialis]MBY8100577.1 GIY-YIG nuclease family protein [Vibrio fluvialis]